MKKQVKFDLPIDGVKVKTLDELRDHFTTEILGHFRTGLLEKWLQSRNLNKELDELRDLSELDSESEDDVSMLKALCLIFGIETNNDAIAAAVQKATGNRGIKIKEQFSSTDAFIWLAWMTNILADLEVNRNISDKSGKFPDLKLNSKFHHPHLTTLTKDGSDKELRRRMVMWSLIAELLNQCPDTRFSTRFMEFTKHKISACISCYCLSQKDHDFVLDSLLSFFPTIYAKYDYHSYPLNYNSFTSLFNAIQRIEWSSVHEYSLVPKFVSDGSKSTLTQDEFRELEKANKNLLRASNILNKSFSQMTKEKFMSEIKERLAGCKSGMALTWRW